MNFAGALDRETAMRVLAEMPGALVCATETGAVTFLNAAAHALIGHDLALDAASLRSLFPSSCADSIVKCSRQTIFDTKILARDGGRLSVRASVLPFDSATGTIIAIFLQPLSTSAMGGKASRPDREQAIESYADPRLAEGHMREIVDMLPEAVCVFDAQDRYVLWNRKYVETYPEIAERLAPGVPFVDILRTSIESGLARERMEDPDAWLVNRLAKHALPSSQEEQQLKDGTWLRHDDRRLASGGAIGMRIDITELKQRELSVRLLFQNNPVPLLIVEPQTLHILDVNEAGTALYGQTRDALLSSSIPDLHVEDEAQRARDTFAAIEEVYDGRAVWRHRNAFGQNIHVLMFARSMMHDRKRSLLVAVADVSDRVHAETQMHHLAHHDALTGLANRFRFQAALETAAQTSGTAPSITLYYLDLDAFKPINDSFGHRGGDHLLQHVARRLQCAIGPNDLVARLGGDEFAILQTDAPDDPPVVAQRLIDALAEPFEIDGQRVTIGVSIGIATTSPGRLIPDDVMLAADTALYEAKRSGKNMWRMKTTGRPVSGKKARACCPIEQIDDDRSEKIIALRASTSRR